MLAENARNSPLVDGEPKVRKPCLVPMEGAELLAHGPEQSVGCSYPCLFRLSRGSPR